TVGDDVYGEDETVNRLEAMTADMLGKEAAMFLSSGTQSNLVAMLSHCGRGDEYIIGDQYHIYMDEAGGPSVLGGIASCGLPVDGSGSLQVEQVNAAIKADDPHYPISRLLCLENTTSGAVQAPAHINMLVDTARSHGLLAHLDGARLMNAAVSLGLVPGELAAPFDSISLCLSKGLGAPIGSVLSGTADFIRRARRARKLVGGGMRQCGILAACGIYALENNIGRLAEDHVNAKRLTEGLSNIECLSVKNNTNMVFLTPPVVHHAALRNCLSEQGILIGGGVPAMRMVTHLDVSADDIERVIKAVTEYFK
ncbi:MAG: low-specificity L-threonine aldolase, partial [Gammaproteobacteria bacterium]|nr:low-specificity L-threonine aldolase [Gammaproteobacteria bacterium]